MYRLHLNCRDAKWETEPNAYAELNEHYNKCDKQPCLCPSGPEFRTSDEVADEYGYGDM